MKPAVKSPVSAAARGQLRLLFSQLETEAAALRRTAAGLPPAMLAAADGKSPTGRRQAIRHVIDRLGAPLWRDPKRAVWRYLQPADGGQVRVMALLIGAIDRPGLVAEPFGLLFSYHSLGRLLDRSAGVACPRATMLAAHDALLRLDPPDGQKLFQLESMLLPAGHGVFLATPNGSREAPLAVAKTWVNADQLHAPQERDLAAWQAVLAAPELL